MQSTLSLKKPLDIKKQAKTVQITDTKAEITKEKLPENQKSVGHSQKKPHPIIFINWLTKTYPNCFVYKNPKPLKRSILQDIFEQGLWTNSKNTLR